MKETVHGFREVDRSADAQYFIQFLDEIGSLESVREGKRLMLEALDIRAGHRVLDVGCGVGADAIEIARLVGETGAVVGVDSSQVMVAEARKRCAGLAIEVLNGDAESLEFPAHSFDACRSERVFMYVDAGRALGEMIRVTKPGGTVVVFDVDHDGISIDSPRPDVTRKMVQFMSDNHRNGIVGRQLRRLFRERGMADVHLRPHSHVLPFSFFERLCGGSVIKAQEAGVITASEGELWLAELAEADRRGVFLMVVPGFIVGGRKTR